MQKTFHGLLLLFILIGMAHGIHQDKITVRKIFQGLLHLLRRIDHPKRHLQNIRIGAQLLRSRNPVGIRSKKSHLPALLHAEFGSNLGYRGRLSDPGWPHEENDLRSLFRGFNLSWLAEFQNHSLIYIGQRIIKRHSRLVQLVNLIDDLVGVLLIHLVLQHRVIQKLHKTLHLTIRFIRELLFLLFRLLELFFDQELKAVQLLLNGVILRPCALLHRRLHTFAARGGTRGPALDFFSLNHLGRRHVFRLECDRHLRL